MDRMRNTAELAAQFSKLSPERRAYLSGYMDGLAFLADQSPRYHSPEHSFASLNAAGRGGRGGVPHRRLRPPAPHLPEPFLIGLQILDVDEDIRLADLVGEGDGVAAPVEADSVLIHHDVAAAADDLLFAALIIAGDAADLTGVEP